MKYIIPEGALKELNEYRATVIAAFGAHIITKEQARKQVWEKTRQVIAYAQAVDDNDTRTIVIQCTGCAKVIIIRAGVMRYHCDCSPNVERFTHQSRELDMPIGKTLVDRFTSANRGPDKISLP